MYALHECHCRNAIKLLQYTEKSTPMAPILPPIRWPTARQIYDRLMREIEPELVSDIVPTLAQTYAKETRAQRLQRLDRYRRAMEIYRRRATAWWSLVTERLHQYYRRLRESAERINHEKEVQSLMRTSFDTTT